MHGETLKFKSYVSLLIWDTSVTMIYFIFPWINTNLCCNFSMWVLLFWESFKYFPKEKKKPQQK